MTLLFNYLFEPFEVYAPEHKIDYFLISLIHAITPTFIICLLYTIRIPPSVEENWSVGKEILIITVYLIAVGVAQFLIRDVIYDNPNNWSWRYFYEEIRNTLLVGTLFSAILVPINFIRLNTKNTRRAGTFNITETPNLKESSLDEKPVIVEIDQEKFDINNLLLAKAEGNYATIHLRAEPDKTFLKRITFKELESLLKPYNHIVKTHRSYLVNLCYVERVTGNAQGYKLALYQYDTVVPVSRNNIARFNKNMGKK